MLVFRTSDTGRALFHMKGGGGGEVGSRLTGPEVQGSSGEQWFVLFPRLYH